MVRLIIMLIAMLGSIADRPRCESTNDLTIKGTIIHENENDAELAGSIHNSSSDTDYENMYVKADFFDTEMEKVGELTFTLKDEAETGQTVPFNIDISEAARIDSVKYTVVCAEVDRPLFRFWK